MSGAPLFAWWCYPVACRTLHDDGGEVVSYEQLGGAETFAAGEQRFFRLVSTRSSPFPPGTTEEGAREVLAQMQDYLTGKEMLHPDLYTEARDWLKSRRKHVSRTEREKGGLPAHVVREVAARGHTYELVLFDDAPGAD